MEMKTTVLSQEILYGEGHCLQNQKVSTKENALFEFFFFLINFFFTPVRAYQLWVC